MSSIRDLTRESHKSAESHPLNKQFIDGSISDEDYNLYVAQRYLIIYTLDNFLPEKFRRAEYFEKDFSPENVNILKSTIRYLNYILRLEHEKLISQIYVNYMGDLHGGQIIKHNNPNRENHHLTFSNELRNEFIHYIRENMSGRDEELAPYANDAFSFLESILNEVQAWSLK